MSQVEFWMSSNEQRPWRRISAQAYEAILNWIEDEPASAERAGLRAVERHPSAMAMHIDEMNQLEAGDFKPLD